MSRRVCVVLVLLWSGALLAALTDGLMLYYDFEEIVDGNTIPDRSGNGYDGQVGGNGTLTLEDGCFGRAAHFEGPDPVYVSLPSPIPHEEIPLDAISIAAWVNHDVMSQHMEIFMAMSGGAYTDQICHTEVRKGDSARFLIRNPVPPAEDMFDIRDIGFVPAEQWVHYAATYDSGQGFGRLYIDGELIAEQPATRTMYDNWDMGARAGYTVDNARPFFGYMDDVAIWRRALTQEEIQQLMEESIQSTPPPVQFRRADANRDGAMNIADGIYILQNLFAQGPPISCPDAADANDDEGVNIADAVYILQVLFAQGPAVPPPYPACGVDTTGAKPGASELGPCDYCAEACQDPPQRCQ